MSWSYEAMDENGQLRGVTIDTIPDECPLCHRKAEFGLNSRGYYNSLADTKHNLEVLFRCPSAECRRAFIGYFEETFGIFSYSHGRPMSEEKRIFSDTIKSISPEFENIYNQALAAESLGLTEICGAGYRKAVEFLVKDYLLQSVTDPDEVDAIKSEYLGTCISTRIKDANIQSVARRAVWLGNDEVHYTRKWEEKDLTDLKNLIDLTVHWMEAEALTAKLLREMPDEPIKTS